MPSTDILVVGGGLAGMRSAVTAAQSGLRVTLAVKGSVCGGASFYPMMDMVACQSSTGVPVEDAWYMEEILDASMGMADKAMNAIYIRDIRQRVAEFPEIGVMDYHQTEPKVACFAKRARPTYVWSDWAGIRRRFRGIVQGTPNLRLMEHTTLAGTVQTDGAVSGALLLTSAGLTVLPCKSLVLATGGMGDLYQFNLNTGDLSGDGQAAALLAGVDLINLEFNQFIPGFVSPAYKTVFRELTIPYLQALSAPDGREVLRNMLPDPALYQECLRLRSKHGPFTHHTIARAFDIAMMQSILDEEGETTGFPIRYSTGIAQEPSSYVRPYYLWLRDKHGVDLAAQEVRIAPFWHAANGGVWIGQDCQTTLPGLFACGEVSGGIHGADRLGGHSTGSCLVFGHIAGQNAARYAAGTVQLSVEAPADAAARLFPGKGTLTPQALLGQIRKLMFRAGSIIREEQRLKEALGQLRGWQQDFAPGAFLDDPGQAQHALKTRNFLLVGQALLMAMLVRRESRGPHYRADFPETNPAYNRRTLIRLKQDAVVAVEEERP